MCIVHLLVYMCITGMHVPQRPEKEARVPDLKAQGPVSSWWMLGTEPLSSARAANALSSHSRQAFKKISIF